MVCYLIPTGSRLETRKVRQYQNIKRVFSVSSEVRLVRVAFGIRNVRSCEE